MRYLVSIHHPAQVHFFRHVIGELRDEGHEVRVCAREKDVSTRLLEAYDIPHRTLAGVHGSIPGLAFVQAVYECRLLRETLRFRPDVITSTGGIEISHVAPATAARSVAFNDSEGTPSHRLMLTRFLDVVCTPRRFRGDFGSAHRRYDGYHELAYLHPDRFDPDGDRLREFGVEPDDPYAVLRFVGWGAHHDLAQRGLSRAAKRELVSSLSEMGDVYITHEGELSGRLERYRTPVPPELLHDLLHYADLYVGDSQTMATEAAVLGTPSIRSNSFAGAGDMSNFVELEEEYGLLYSTANEQDALGTARTLAAAPDTTEKWRRRRDRLVSEKIDVASYAVDVLREEGRRARSKAATVRPSGLDHLRGFLSRGGSK